MQFIMKNNANEIKQDQTEFQQQQKLPYNSTQKKQENL